MFKSAFEQITQAGVFMSAENPPETVRKELDRFNLRCPLCANSGHRSSLDATRFKLRLCRAARAGHKARPPRWAASRRISQAEALLKSPSSDHLSNNRALHARGR
jgi:hypothetical protein